MNLALKPLKSIDLTDSFFDSLREDYDGFDHWYQKKADDNKEAYVFELDNQVNGFLLLKDEKNLTITDVTPVLPARKWLKVGTFKVNPHGTRLGERFLKKVFDYATHNSFDTIYVTVLPKHTALIELFQKYGFRECATKGAEKVFVKTLLKTVDDILLDYPKFNIVGTNKFLLSVYPEYHIHLFPDSILNNESYDQLADVTHTNSIEKVYICAMNCSRLRAGDNLVIYRTKDKSDMGKAYYRSVVTSVCTVEAVKTRKDFRDLEDYLLYCERHSVFERPALTDWYQQDKPLYVIKMVYNAAFKKRITRGHLIEEVGVNGDDRWGFYPLTDNQFINIIKQGAIHESLIINQTTIC
ncbi:MAG: hypothetical protein RLZZ628_2719 [Bacteroidota bacterium]